VSVDDGFWRDRNVLVTGCSGLLGGWLSGALIEAGAHTIGLVRDQDPRSRLEREGIGRRMTLVYGDITDREAVERAVNEYEVATIFHLAAQTIVGTANRSPLSTFRSNIEGTWNVLEAARLIGTVEQVLVASSDKAYGSHEQLPYAEDAPLHGEHPYDVSKSCGDLIAAAYHRSYGVPVCVTRCGNFYGGGDLNFNRIVPGTIRSVLRDERPVIRSDGEYTRDYIYIEDAVDAYISLAEGMARSPEVTGEAFNFSCERPLKVIELTSMILSLMERQDIEPIVQGEATNEIRDQFLSAAKARERLGWRPRFGIEEGLVRTIDWYRDFLGSAGAAA
jgi:CDP-glucose 4,6-dehydratase